MVPIKTVGSESPKGSTAEKTVSAPTTATQPKPTQKPEPQSGAGPAKPATRLAGNAKPEPTPETQKTDSKPGFAESKLQQAAPGTASVGSVGEQPASPKKEADELGPKLRRVGDIKNALRAGGTLVLAADGLYCMVNASGGQCPVSKRRAASLIGQGLVKVAKADATGKHYVHDPAAEADTKKPASANAGPKPESGAPKAALPAKGA